LGFIITHYFSVSNLHVFWDVCEFDKETCVGSRSVTDTLKEASYFVAKTSFPKWLQASIFHNGHVFHFFSSHWLNDCIGVVLLGSMVIAQRVAHVGYFHVEKVVLGQVLGERFCERIGTLGSADRLVIGVTTLGSNEALVVS
jgi:hypothetical protein